MSYEAQEEGLTIGKKNKAGDTLVLGGWNADLFRSPSGIFKIGNEVLIGTGTAVDAYNRWNGTKLPDDYIERYFHPFMEKNFSGKKVLRVPSSSGKASYDVTIDEYGDITCTCKGFEIRHKCRHSDAVRELLHGK